MAAVFDRGHQLTIEALTSEVLAALKENREKHLANYEEAKKGFYKEAIRKLSSATEKVKAEEEAAPKTPKNVYISLNPPTCHVKVYDTAIRMLELHVNAGKETIKLGADQVDSLVHDRWDWSGTFSQSVAMYTDDVVGAVPEDF